MDMPHVSQKKREKIVSQTQISMFKTMSKEGWDLIGRIHLGLGTFPN